MRCTIPRADLSQKLNETICMYKGTPVYVHVQGGDLTLYPLPARTNPFKIPPTDPEFDISTPPLGYMQVDNETVAYIRRLPIRRSVQGLSRRNMDYEPLPNNRRGKIPTGNYIFTQGFVDCILNNFPSLDSSMKKLRGLHGKNPDVSYETAVSREIALSIQESTGIIHVFYKNELVGWIAPNKFIVEVASNEKGWIVSKFLSSILGWEIN